jgi:thiol-disulfide isomerase/thioredoxin
MNMRTLQPLTAAGIGCLLAIGPADLSAQTNVHTVPLTYNVRGEGPRPNFMPTGTRVELAEVPAEEALPPGAVHPARRGVLQVGPTGESWIPFLLTATADEPGVFTRLYIDMNRNGDFSDDGPPAVATLERNEETGNLRIGFRGIELRVHFPEPERTEPYAVSFWMFHWAANPEPDDFIRYSGDSWRSGSFTVNGVPALVAAMDRNNDALYGPGDNWGIVEASMPEASRYVMSFHFGTGKGEMHPTDRLMFVQRGGGEADLVLEFRSFAADGSSVTFAVVDYPISKTEDREAEFLAAAERARPRAASPYTWAADLEAAMAAANASGKPLFLYFETDWCGPCIVMDEWIWTDAEVVAALQAGYVGVKLDGDVETEHVERYNVKGYPTLLIVDPASGTVLESAYGYKSSQQLLELLRGTGGSGS